MIANNDIMLSDEGKVHVREGGGSACELYIDSPHKRKKLERKNKNDEQREKN